MESNHIPLLRELRVRSCFVIAIPLNTESLLVVSWQVPSGENRVALNTLT